MPVGGRLERPSWWSPRRAAWAAGALFVGILLALGWALILRRQVRRQTQGIDAAREAAEAASGKEALRLPGEAAGAGDPFAAAMLDMHKPDVDGLMPGRQIRADPLVAGTALVLMTSLGQPGDARAAGMDDFISKPVSADAVAGVLERWLLRRPAAG